ncbi:MAG: hypothetical protein CO103_07000, partial [Chloroflexi bacterium CG_4_9_14_3_um_filter_45_9]
MIPPLHRVNVLTGTKSAMAIDSAQEYADLIHRAKRPLFVLGPLLSEWSLDGKLVIEYALEIAKAA